MKENISNIETPRLRDIGSFEDLRGCDLFELDLGSVTLDILRTVQFDTQTKWPPPERLPAGFNPELLLIEGQDPGLGVRGLHEKGIDGRGVNVAIIDQTLSGSNGELLRHVEFRDNLACYREFGTAKSEMISYHGPAVASLLVGRNCGVSPAAELSYFAVPSGRSFDRYAEALMEIIKHNRKVNVSDKIKIVSCSIGFDKDKPEPGLARWIETLGEVEKSGLIVVHCGMDNDLACFGGGGSAYDKDNIDSYGPPFYDKFGDLVSNLLREYDNDTLAVIEKINNLHHLDDSRVTDDDLLNIDKYLVSRGDYIIVPSDFRSMASSSGQDEYLYEGRGGFSWSVPYLAGVFALALQVRPELSGCQIAKSIKQSAYLNRYGYRVINPSGALDCLQSKTDIAS